MDKNLKCPEQTKLLVGTKIILGKHTGEKFQRNWSEDMNKYVGTEAIITRIGGIDFQGFLVCSVNTNEWNWRIANIIVTDLRIVFNGENFNVG